MENKFTSKVELSILGDLGTTGYSLETHYYKMEVKYSSIIDMRDWGISEISFQAPDQEFSITLEVVRDGEDDYEEMTANFKIKDLKIEEPRMFSSGFAPETLEIKMTSVKLVENQFEIEGTGELIFNQSNHY